MIHEVDESLRKIALRDAINGSDAELSFDAPTKDWAARRNAPTVDLYLYDIHEDLERRNLAYERVQNDEGRTVGRRPPPRRFSLSYLITAWTQRPEDEHRLLAGMLSCFLRFDALPPSDLYGALGEQPLPVLVTIGQPPPESLSISDLWTALGGELKPSLDLVVTVPFDTARVGEAGPPVLEEPRFSLVSPESDDARAPETRGRTPKPRGRRRPAPAAPEAPAAEELEETVQAGKEDQPGRILRVRRLPPA